MNELKGTIWTFGTAGTWYKDIGLVFAIDPDNDKLSYSNGVDKPLWTSVTSVKNKRITGKIDGYYTDKHDKSQKLTITFKCTVPVIS